MIRKVKSKLFPQCKQRIHPVNILLFFNRMILNSGRHTQPDPQSCRVRSLGGRRGSPKTNNASRDQTKLSSATPNRDKTIHCRRKHRKKHPSNVAAESAPHPRHIAKACDNNTQTIPNNMVLWHLLCEVPSYTQKTKYIAAWIYTARICFLAIVESSAEFWEPTIGNSISLPGTCPTPLRIFRQLFSAFHLPIQSPARLRLIVFFVISVGLFGPPLSLVWISSHPSFGLLLIFVRPPLSFLAASFFFAPTP